MDLVFNLNEVQEVEEAQAGGYGILESGMYKNCTIVRAVASKTKAGNNTIDLTFKTETGHETTIYQAFCMDPKWASGKENKYGYARFLRFAKAAGMTSAETFKDPLVDNDGKAVLRKGTQEPVIFDSYKDLANKKVDLGVQKCLDIYNGKETEDNEIYDTFACGSESSDKLGSRIKDKKSEAWKKANVDGGVSADTAEPETEAATQVVDEL
jgi:hypothetical protein